MHSSYYRNTGHTGENRPFRAGFGEILPCFGRFISPALHTFERCEYWRLGDGIFLAYHAYYGTKNTTFQDLHLFKPTVLKGVLYRLPPILFLPFLRSNETM